VVKNNERMTDVKTRNLLKNPQSHLQMHTDDNIGFSVTRDQVRRKTILELGGIEQTWQLYRHIL
jgi:hypothetical protein